MSSDSANSVSTGGISPGDRGKAIGARRDVQFEDAIDQIRQALHGLRYGEVSVVVQDGVVVQLERRERKRLRGAQP